jgi:CheY-like chemotaxis protein
MPAPALSGPRSLRVLVIEDNSDAAETLGDLLRLFGHEAEVALSGPEGLAAARSLRPDVVLCDIGLPGMDGYAVASSLRSEPATRTTHLVALTGYGRDSDRRRTQEAGFDLHLVKPLEPLELKRLLDEWAKG